MAEAILLEYDILMGENGNNIKYASSQLVFNVSLSFLAILALYTLTFFIFED